MLRVKIIETGEIKTLSIIDPRTNTDFHTADVIYNEGGFESGDFISIGDGMYSCTQYAYEYWEDQLAKLESIEKRIYKTSLLLKERMKK